MGEAAVKAAEYIKYEGAGTFFDKHIFLFYGNEYAYSGRAPYYGTGY
jgi:hypothetical protein